MNDKYRRKPRSPQDKGESTTREGEAQTAGSFESNDSYQNQRNTRKGQVGRSKQAQGSATGLSWYGCKDTGSAKKNGGGLRRLLMILALVVLAVSASGGNLTELICGITPSIHIVNVVKAQDTTPRYSGRAETRVEEKIKTRIRKDMEQEGAYVYTPKMSLVRRRHIALSPVIDADIYAGVTLIVLDTEGLAYHTTFTRKLLWVTRVTDNLLNIRKPYVQSNQHVCAIDNIVKNDVTWGKHLDEKYGEPEQEVNANENVCDESTRKKIFARHLVPSFDGYIYCVYENNQTQLLHIHVRDIVNYTPFRTPLLEGVYLEGSRTSSVMALDYDNGHYITRHVHHDDMLNPFGKKMYEQKKQKTQKQLHIGYTDWIVRAFDERTHDELWSFNWREIGPVNSENSDIVTVERIKEGIEVRGHKLYIRHHDDDDDENGGGGYDDDEDEDDDSTEALDFPFPIAAVYAVMWNVKEEIMTLQLLERVSIPPPPAFLESAFYAAYGSLRLGSSSYFGRNVISVKNGVINIYDGRDSRKRESERRNDGTLFDIQRVDQTHYYTLDTQMQKITIIQQVQTKRRFLKFWVVVSWAFTFVSLLILWILRKVACYFGMDKHCPDLAAQMPYAKNFVDKITGALMEMERAAFASTEKFIYNVTSASQIYPMDAVYKRLVGPTDVNGQIIVNADSRNGNELHTIASSRTDTVGATDSSVVDADKNEENDDAEKDAEDVTEQVESKSDTIRSISIVPIGTSLAEFLENGRFIRTFECTQLLGKGGFGSVYQVQHKLEPGNPIYAVKFVLLKLRASEGLASRRYFREVSANREIYSKYVVRYFTWWCEEPHFLPLMQMTPQIQTAAAENVKYLISTKALTSKNKRALDGYLQQYEEAVKEIVQKSSGDSYPSFSKIAFNRQTRAHVRRRRETLEAIGENSDDDCDESDSMLGSGANGFSAFNCTSEGSDLDIEYPESSNGVVFEDSDAPPISDSNESEEPQLSKHDQAQAGGHHGHIESHKEVEKQYPVVLLILMELCKGFTLREWLNRPERSEVPLEYTMSQYGIPVEFYLFKQLVKGLRDIHANNFIHRDLKPENIFVDPVSYALKIGDFGLVGFISQDNHKENNTTGPVVKRTVDMSQTSLPGQVIGTPGYTAPEGGVNCTEKADIFSAALILLELLTPKLSTSMERFAMLENFRTACKVPTFISNDLKPWHQLLQQMGDPIPKNRPSATEVQKILKVILNTPQLKSDQ